MTAIDRVRRTIVVTGLNAGVERDEPYDALVLSPGAAPIHPAMPGVELPVIFAVRTIPDSVVIRTWIMQRRPRSAHDLPGAPRPVCWQPPSEHRGRRREARGASRRPSGPIVVPGSRRRRRERRDVCRSGDAPSRRQTASGISSLSWGGGSVFGGTTGRLLAPSQLRLAPRALVGGDGTATEAVGLPRVRARRDGLHPELASAVGLSARARPGTHISRLALGLADHVRLRERGRDIRGAGGLLGPATGELRTGRASARSSGGSPARRWERSSPRIRPSWPR